MKLEKVIIFFVFILLSNIIIAQPNEKCRNNVLIPTYHWSYEYLEQLRVRGYLRDLNFSVRPFWAGAVNLELNKLTARKDSQKRQIDVSTLILVERLQRSFHSLNSNDSSKARLKTQLFIGNDLYSESSNEKWVDHFIPRARIGFQFGRNLAVQNTILTSNRIDENPEYLGKLQSGLASYTEEAYLVYRVSHFNFLLGRSFLRWGPGHTGTLLLSDYARPLDQFSVDFFYKWLRFSFVTASLNTMSDSTVANRYFSAHRLDLTLSKNLRFGISEAVLYGGPNTSVQFPFHNPVIFLHGIILNGPTHGNSLGSIDFSYYPIRNLHFYGEILIDDIQLEKSSPVDLEPTEWGLQLGIQFSKAGLFLQSEYVRIANRTYNTVEFWERYTHRNDPIGYYSGNDFDHFYLRGNYWLKPCFRVQAKFQHIRQGEGRVNIPFDSPWLDLPPGQEYSEPFPTGVVEQTQRVQLELRWHPLRIGYGEIILGYEQIKNVDNRIGENLQNWYYSLKLWLELGKGWIL